MITSLLKNFIKIYLYDLIAFWLCAVVFVSSSFFLFKSWYEYKHNKECLEKIIQRENQIYKIEKVINTMDNELKLPKYFDKFYIITVNKTFNIYPFSDLLNKISSIYDSPGFFFLKSLDLNTCLDYNLPKDNKCKRLLKISGEKILFEK